MTEIKNINCADCSKKDQIIKLQKEKIDEWCELAIDRQFEIHSQKETIDEQYHTISTSNIWNSKLKDEIESLKAITELAVKRMQDLSTHICDITVKDVYFEGYSELKKKAFEYASEIEKLQK